MFFKRKILKNSFIIVKFCFIVFNQFQEYILAEIENIRALNPQSCPNLTLAEQASYERLTSKLGYMKKAILPVQKRKASFISTDEFRLSTLTVLNENFTIFPSIKKNSQYSYANVLLAGTGKKKLK